MMVYSHTLSEHSEKMLIAASLLRAENERLRGRMEELEALAQDLADRIHEKDAILHHFAVAATAARNRINDLEVRLASTQDTRGGLGSDVSELNGSAYGCR